MIKIGDTIKPIDEIGTYTVTQICGNTIVAEDQDEFEYTFATSQIVVVPKQNVLRFAQSIASKDQPRSQKKKSKPQKKRNVLELDLHATVLLENTAGMSKHEILLEQISQAKGAVLNARKQGYTHVVLIHGKGTGRLKTELHNMLRQLDRIQYYDAEYFKFSTGATEVKVF